MILSAQSIRARGIIAPFHERTVAEGMTFGLGPAGYDVRIAEPVWLHHDALYLASTIEHFTMPPDLVGHVCDKSSWARQGVFAQNTIIEPGWRGHLTLELTYHGDADVFHIVEGSPIVQILFSQLDAPTERPYDGKYQDQQAGPQAARFEECDTCPFPNHCRKVGRCCDVSKRR